MSNYYSSGYPSQQQQSGGNDTGSFYGGNGYGQAPQQQQQESQQYQDNQSSFVGYGSQPTQQWQGQQPQSTQPGMGATATNQQQQQAPQPNLFNPNAAATMMSMAGSVAAGGGLSEDAMLRMGQNIWKSSSARMVPGLESAMGMLRLYFAVDNRYVKRKMQKVLFPFLSKNWRRTQVESTGPDFDKVEYALPNSDENAPDLYIPCMSLITYVLLCALCYGTAGEFNPEVLPDVTSKCFITQVVEVLGIRFGMYVMQAPVAFLDLFSYTGYKYLGLCINMLVGIALGHLGYGHRGFYITFAWTASAASFFMLKTMANNIPIVTSATGPKREVMVCAFAASQFATMWFVSQTKFLD